MVLLKEFIKLNVNTDMTIKMWTCGVKYNNCECYLKYTSIIDDLVDYKYLCLNIW